MLNPSISWNKNLKIKFYLNFKQSLRNIHKTKKLIYLTNKNKTITHNLNLNQTNQMLMMKLKVIGDQMILWLVEDIFWKNNSRKKLMIDRIIGNHHMILINLNQKQLRPNKNLFLNCLNFTWITPIKKRQFKLSRLNRLKQKLELLLVNSIIFQIKIKENNIYKT